MEKKKGFTLPAPALKAAQHFQAKGDIRFYLNGILVDPAGFIAAINGRVLFKCESEEAATLSAPLIIELYGNIPAHAFHADFAFAGPDTGVVTFRDGGGASVNSKGCRGRKCMIGFGIIDGKFPDIQKAMPVGEPVAVSAIGINTDYVALISKANKALGCSLPGGTFVFRGAEAGIEVKLMTPHYNAVAIIMPMRI
jgi:hypothetical protein